MEMQFNIIRKYSAIPFKKTNKSGLHRFPSWVAPENKLHFFLVYYRCSFFFFFFTTDVLKLFSLSPLLGDLLKDRSWASLAWISHTICWKSHGYMWQLVVSQFISWSLQGAQGPVDGSISISQLQISGTSCQDCVLLFLPLLRPHLSALPSPR